MRRGQFKVYLAGGLSTEWKETVRRVWSGTELEVEAYDPMSQSRQLATYQFVADDLHEVANSDLVFAVVDYPRYTGLVAEIGFAHARGVPVVLVWDGSSDSTPKRVDMFVAALAKAVFTDVVEAAVFARERLFSQKVQSPFRDVT